VFGLHIPDHVHGVPDEVLHPRLTWEHPEQYDAQAQKLAAMFRENFEKFAENVTEGVRKAGP
jgi:phosphoenolpyruvate carboxykinase (ATP)